MFVAAGVVNAGTLNASWIAPTTKDDGSPLADLDSYRLYYGTTNTPCPGGTYLAVPSPVPDPGPGQTVTATITGLTSGTAYFAAVTAVDMSGDESACSTVVSAVAPNAVPTLGSLSPSSAAAGGAAFTLTVTGTDFVAGSFVQWNGSARTTTFVSSTQLTAAIAAADIATAGTASVTVFSPTPGGGTSTALTFTITIPSNPAPTLTSVSPTVATAGSAAFTLTATGTNFVAGSIVQWNGSARTTTFVSSTQLTAAITAADIAAAGTASVTVFSPTPGGGTSTALTFTITSAPSDPAPTLSAVSPASVIAGDAAFTLTATGTNFVAGSVVQWNGSARATTFVSTTQLTAAITAADIATTGTAAVTVFSPTPGGGTSTALTVTINNPAPTLSYVSPKTTKAGGAGFTLTATGTNFVAGSVVQWNGSARTTTFVSSAQLTATITAADIAIAGTAWVTVFSPTPGGGTSTAMKFTIKNPSPKLTSLSPTSATAGGSAFTLTATGANFIAGSVVRWKGSARPTTFVTSTELTAAISAADIATAGTAWATVFSPTPGGGTSTAVRFTINNPTPTLTSISPASATAGSGAFTLTATGTDFVAGSVVRWNGGARTTTFLSRTELRAAITAADVAAAGTAYVTVFSPTPGGGTSSAAVFSIN